MKTLLTVALLAGTVLLPASFAHAGYVDLVSNDPGLVSYWRFEDAPANGEGGTAVDEKGISSGEYGVGLQSAPGVAGTSVFFPEDAEAVVEIMEVEPYNFTESLTVEAWFKSDELTSAWQSLLGKGDSQWRIHRLEETGSFTFGTNSGSNPTDLLRDDRNLPAEERELPQDMADGTWRHIVGVFDATNDLDNEVAMKQLYLDGNLIGEQEVIGDIRTDCGANCDLPVMIGGNSQKPDEGFRAFSGWIDEVALYDRPLSAADIEAHYADGLALLTGPSNDFSGNGILDLADVDLLRDEVIAGSNSGQFDLTSDGVVDFDDIVSFVEGSVGLNSWIGDANLDGEFNSSDFVSVFQAGEYEDGVPMNSTWATGDWTGDGEFDSGDFVAAFQSGGFELGPREVAAVPEPSSLLLFTIGTLALLRLRR